MAKIYSKVLLVEGREDRRIIPELMEALGILIDADEEPRDRWRSIKNACKNSISSLPESLPNSGLIHVMENEIKFGIWMMPDNQMRGMLETFLAFLIPTKASEELSIC